MLAVAAIFKAVNRYGRDAGKRTFQYVAQRVAAYERMSSSARGSGNGALDHRDRHREERQVHGDDDDARDARPEGVDDHRGQRHDRDRLARDDVRQWPALREPEVDEDRGQEQPEQGAQHEPDERLAPRRRPRPKVLQQRLVGTTLDRLAEHGQDHEPVREVQVVGERPAEGRVVEKSWPEPNTFSNRHGTPPSHFTTSQTTRIATAKRPNERLPPAAVPPVWGDAAATAGSAARPVRRRRPTGPAVMRW